MGEAKILLFAQLKNRPKIIMESNNSNSRFKTGVKGFSCKYCPKRYTAGCNLSRHLHDVHYGRVFTCESCGKRVKDKAMQDKVRKKNMPSENQGQFIVESETTQLLHAKNYSCKLCPKRYSSNGSLFAHVNDDHKGRRFLCECGKKLKGYVNKYKHMREAHRGKAKFQVIYLSALVPLVQKEFSCYICKKLFATNVTRLEHLETIHRGRRFRCCRCGTVLKGSAPKSKHMKKCGRDTKFETIYEDDESSSSSGVPVQRLSPHTSRLARMFKKAMKEGGRKNLTNDLYEADSEGSQPTGQLREKEIAERPTVEIVDTRIMKVESSAEEGATSPTERISVGPSFTCSDREVLESDVDYSHSFHDQELVSAEEKPVTQDLDAIQDQINNEKRVEIEIKPSQPKCCFCHVSLEQDDTSKKHALDHLEMYQTKTFCPVCKLDFQSPSRVFDHVLMAHFHLRKLVCKHSHCVRSFWLEKTLKRHENSCNSHQIITID